MWSLGCTLFELFQKLSPNQSYNKKEIVTQTHSKDLNQNASSNILFPGTSCFPLSVKQPEMRIQSSVQTPVSQANLSSGYDSCDLQTDKNDQLIMILKQINPLSDVDICFVERQEMIEYVSGMKNLQEIEKVADFHYLDRLGPLEEDWFMLMHNLL